MSNEAGVSFQLPSNPDWARINVDFEAAREKVPYERLVYQRLDKTAVVQFTFFAGEPAATNLDKAYIQGWEKHHYSNLEMKKVSAKFITFKSKRAYQVDDQVRRDTQRQFTTILWLNQDGRLCSISASKQDADPLQDTLIKNFIDSLKFLPKTSK